MSENDEIIGQENCIQHQIELTGQQEIILIQPGDGEKIDLEEKLTFPWIPLTPVPKDGYSIMVAEIRGNHSPQEAITNNLYYFTQDRIRSALIQYPLNAPKLKPNTRYAWKVTTTEGGKEVLTSEIFTFSVGKSTSQPTDNTSSANDSCDNLKATFKKIPDSDNGQCKVLIANKIQGAVNNRTPAALKITVKSDSNFTVKSDAPKKWKREVLKGTLDTTIIIWKHESGAIPAGETELDDIYFGKNIRSSSSVRYEWLDKAGGMMYGFREIG